MQLIRMLAAWRPDLTDYRNVVSAYRITFRSLARRYLELHDEIAGQILGLYFPTFFAPKAHKGCFVRTHDDPGVRATDEKASFELIRFFVCF